MPVVSFMPYFPDVGVDKTYGDFRIWNWWKHREEVVTDPTSKRAVGWWKRPAGRSARTGVAGGGPTPCVSPRITVSPSRGTWCRSIPWSCGLCRVWSSSTLRLAL